MPEQFISNILENSSIYGLSTLKLKVSKYEHSSLKEDSKFVRCHFDYRVSKWLFLLMKDYASPF